MEREWVRVKNREYTLKEDITKNGIKVGMFEITAKISDELAFQIVSGVMVALKKVIMIFKHTARRTVGTLTSMTTMYNIANW